MRIIQVITRSDVIAGASCHLMELTLGLIGRGHEVMILTGGEGVLSRALTCRKLAHEPLKHLKRPIAPIHDVRAILEIRDRIRSYNPDLAALHSSKAGFLGRIACKLTGTPCVFTAHGWAFTEGKSAVSRVLYRTLETLSAPLSSRIITVSDYDRKLALQLGVTDRSNLVTIHNGVRDTIHNGVREASSGDRTGDRSAPIRCSPVEVPRIIMVARFESPKDHPSLLDAMALLHDLRWELVLVGDGPLRDQAERRAKRLGIHKRIRFLGHRNDVSEQLACSDIFVLASHYEGFPLSILEAMVNKLPVVATDVGGIQEQVVNDETGFIVPPSDVPRIATALRRLIVDEPLRRTMGFRGRERVLRKFEFDGMVDQTLAVYEDVLRYDTKRYMADSNLSKRLHVDRASAS